MRKTAAKASNRSTYLTDKNGNPLQEKDFPGINFGVQVTKKP